MYLVYILTLSSIQGEGIVSGQAHVIFNAKSI